MNISGSTFANNTSTGGGGGAMSRFTAVEVRPMHVFNHNVAQGNGGAIDQKDSSGGITLLRRRSRKTPRLPARRGHQRAPSSTGRRPYTFTDSKFTFNSSAGQRRRGIVASGETR